MDEKDEMSIKEAAEAVVEAMDFKGEVIVSFNHIFLEKKTEFFCQSSIQTNQMDNLRKQPAMQS